MSFFDTLVHVFTRSHGENPEHWDRRDDRPKFFAALESNDQKLLARIALGKTIDFGWRIDAIKRLTDQRALRRIAIEEPEIYVRVEAGNRLTGQSDRNKFLSKLEKTIQRSLFAMLEKTDIRPRAPAIKGTLIVSESGSQNDLWAWLLNRLVRGDPAALCKFALDTRAQFGIEDDAERYSCVTWFLSLERQAHDPQVDQNYLVTVEQIWIARKSNDSYHWTVEKRGFMAST